MPNGDNPHKALCRPLTRPGVGYVTDMRNRRSHWLPLDASQVNAVSKCRRKPASIAGWPSSEDGDRDRVATPYGLRCDVSASQPRLRGFDCDRTQVNEPNARRPDGRHRLPHQSVRCHRRAATIGTVRPRIQVVAQYGRNNRLALASLGIVRRSAHTVNSSASIRMPGGPLYRRASATTPHPDPTKRKDGAGRGLRILVASPHGRRHCPTAGQT